MRSELLMIIIAHRVNTIVELVTVPPQYGVEIDIRHDNRTGRLYLNHDPERGDDLEEYLKHFKHLFLIFNVKECGVEDRCITLAAQYGIPKENYFILDAEFPWIYRALNQGVGEVAIRYSEAEAIEQALLHKGHAHWLWIDTNTKLPLDADVVEKIRGYKTCLVSPDRWGRPQDIPAYRAQMEDLRFELDAVMVGQEYIHQWE